MDFVARGGFFYGAAWTTALSPTLGRELTAHRGDRKNVLENKSKKQHAVRL